MTILWDWNGTLLDDTRQCVDALNDLLARRSLPPITLEYHRRFFAFPARDFYATIGMDLESEDWDALAKEYHDAYHSRPARLAPDAVEALDLAKRLGFRQHIVSALRQDFLDEAVKGMGIDGYFAGLCGSDNLDGASKMDRAKAYVRDLEPDDFVLIGDSIHDKEVADAIGARCLLYGGGSHAPERLFGIAPVFNSLVDAVNFC
ncbi:MAG: HAD family hydrolase [Kiritimatiellae bacterium]|nr:HAD family hydrolase [Kiritimatiellia bacterium]